MAEAFAVSKGIVAESAGTLPAATPNPLVVEAMREIGFDISAKKPKMLTQKMIEDADLVVTMGCSVEQACPKPMLARMQKKLVDWGIEDPKGKSIEQIRDIRDDIGRRVLDLAMHF